MSILSTPRRIISTLVAILHTRLDLIRVELEEEVIRFSSYFIYALIALFCGGVAVSFILVLILVLFWEEHRITVMLSFIVIFGVVSASIFSWLRNQIASKPHLLEQSIAEFKKDMELMHSYEQDPDQQTGREL
jgi:uncharacterized membrane protein YqjE